MLFRCQVMAKVDPPAQGGGRIPPRRFGRTRDGPGWAVVVPGMSRLWISHPAAALSSLQVAGDVIFGRKAEEDTVYPFFVF